MRELADRPPVRPQAAPPRRIAVMPAYNEEATVAGVLERLEPLVDELIVVDDGSTDRTRQVIFTWAEDHPHVHLLCFNRNRGMSAAYYAAFQEVGRRVSAAEWSPDDVILTVDADGQHDPAEVDALVDKVVTERYDAVIARRDLSTYTGYKRLGNFLMSLWASLWAGHRLYDVESGFRAFRAGALLAALRYYKGYKYSETVEVAVILPHLGYRVSNDLLVPIPVFRSRTRLKDVAIDLAAMPAAWWRVVAGRTRPNGISGRATYLLPLLAPLFLLFMVVDLLVAPIFLGDDSVNNYAHVWFISQQLFEHGTIPLRISMLDGGRAITIPYAMVPYLVNALVFRVLGDWSVTLFMAAAVVATVWAAGLARPVMREPWFLLLFLINPFFIDAVYVFQYATLWSAAFFFLFVWSFERRRYLLSAVLLWLAVSTHPITGGLAAGVYLLCIAALDRRRLRPLLLTGAPVAVALVPVFWMMMQTPSVRENSLLTVVFSVLDVLPRRGSIVLLPFAFTALAPWFKAHYRVTLGAFGLAAFLGVLAAGGPLPQTEGSYYGAIHRSTDIYAAFFRSSEFQPGATYRVMEPNEREDGIYRFMQHGAVISNEFFSESMMRRNWTQSQYGCYTAFKGVEYVVVEQAFQRQYDTNEGALLRSLVAAGGARVSYSDPAGKFTVYDIRSFVAAQQKSASLSQCGLY